MCLGRIDLIIIPQFDQGGVHKGGSIMLNDPPSPSLNDNLSITVDRLIYIPVANKTSGSARSSNS